MGRYIYPYPRPIATADVVVLAHKKGASQRAPGDDLFVLSIKRRNDPYANCWALPGGYLEENEPPMAGAARDLEEETGLSGLVLHELGFFGAPGRDPRGWTITLAYWTILPDDCQAGNIAKAGDDAAEAGWFPANDLPPLAFDHVEIVQRAISDSNPG